MPYTRTLLKPVIQFYMIMNIMINDIAGIYILKLIFTTYVYIESWIPTEAPNLI